MDNVLNQKKLSKMNFINPICTEYLSRKIHERISMPFVVLCLGTDKDISDSLGPITGHFLSSDQAFCCPVFGTLSKPVHNENLLFNLDIIRHQYPKHSLLVIDAAMGKKENFGEIVLIGADESFFNIRSNQMIRAGDLTILGLSDYEDSHVNWLNSVRLNTVYKMAEMIAKAVKTAID